MATFGTPIELAALGDLTNAELIATDGTATQQAVDDRIAPVAADIIASDEAVRAGILEAAEAVNVVTAPPVGNTGYDLPFTSSNGKEFGGLYTDGTIELLLQRTTAAEMSRIASAADAMTKTSTTAMFAGVDSLTRGFTGGVDWNLNEAWPYLLQQSLTGGVTVSNNGTSGQPIDEFAIRIGAIKLTFTVTGGNIPASGTPVTVTTAQVIGWVPNRTSNMTGWLVTSTGVQVPGVLSRTSGGDNFALTFTPSSGTGTAVTGDVTFKSVDDSHSWDLALIWPGRNDVSFGVTGAEGSVAAHVVATLQKIVAYLAAQRKKFLIFSPSRATNEASTSANGVTNATIYSACQILWPFNTEDLGGYLASLQILTDMGLTPTSDDLTKIAAGSPAPQIIYAGDTIHYIKAVHPKIAAFAKAALVKRGWAA